MFNILLTDVEVPYSLNVIFSNVGSVPLLNLCVKLTLAYALLIFVGSVVLLFTS